MNLFRICLVALLAAFSMQSATAAFLYGVSVGSTSIREFNATTGATISTTPLTMAGFTLLGATGMAADPTTGTFYGLMRVSGQSGRQLATINPITGVVTSIGNTGNGAAFSSLAFTSAGVLYGTTGDGGSPSETLFTIDKTTGVPTLVTALGNGTDGEVIAFNPVDGLMYHASGNTNPFTFESINLTTLAITGIPVTGATSNEVWGLTWDAVNSRFIGNNINGNFFALTTGGVQSTIGPISSPGGQLRGLTFSIDPVDTAVPAPAAVWMGLAGVGLIAGLRRRFAKV